MIKEDFYSKNLIKKNEQLIKEYDEGKDVRQKLVINNLPIIDKTLQELKLSSSNDFDDYYSQGLLGLTKAINEYKDCTENVPFGPFARRYIKHEIIEYKIKNDRQTRLYINDLDEDERMARESARHYNTANPEQIYLAKLSNQEDKATIKKLFMTKINPSQRQILHYKYFYGNMSKLKFEKQIGTTLSHLSNECNKALLLLQHQDGKFNMDAINYDSILGRRLLKNLKNKYSEFELSELLKDTLNEQELSDLLILLKPKYFGLDIRKIKRLTDEQVIARKNNLVKKLVKRFPEMVEQDKNLFMKYNRIENLAFVNEKLSKNKILYDFYEKYGQDSAKVIQKYFSPKQRQYLIDFANQYDEYGIPVKEIEPLNRSEIYLDKKIFELLQNLLDDEKASQLLDYAERSRRNSNFIRANTNVCLTVEKLKEKYGNDVHEVIKSVVSPFCYDVLSTKYLGKELLSSAQAAKILGKSPRQVTANQTKAIKQLDALLNFDEEQIADALLKLNPKEARTILTKNLPERQAQFMRLYLNLGQTKINDEKEIEDIMKLSDRQVMRLKIKSFIKLNEVLDLDEQKSKQEVSVEEE